MAELVFPTTVEVKTLDQAHPQHARWSEAWQDFDILRQAGDVIRKEAWRFLDKRGKEPQDIFEARLKRFIYTPLLPTILGWYTGKVFRTDPTIDKSPADADGKQTDGELSPEQADFFARFEKHCDLGGCSFNDMFRDLFRDMMLYRTAYLLMDLPESDPNEFRNLREQLEAGALNVYVTRWEADSVLNWSEDAGGNLDWVVLRSYLHESGLFTTNVCVDRWTIFTRTDVAVYERRYSEGDDDKPEHASLVNGPRPHVQAALNRVPLYRMQIPEDLWIANRISLPARAYLNLENSLDWSLYNNNLAQPVISGAFDGNALTYSEIGAWLLPEGCKVEFLEQSGNAFTISQDRLERLREEIYRAAYLMDQGRSTEATPASQSGISKQADKEPANDVLSAFGDVLRRWMQQVLTDAAATRGIEGVAVDVRGFDFSDDDPTLLITNAQQVLALNIPSDTLDKELMKGVALALLPDANQVTKDKIAEEITTAGSRQERELDRMKQEQQVMADTVRTGMSKAS